MRRRWWIAVIAVTGLALAGALGWAASTGGGERRLETVVPDPPATVDPPPAPAPDVASLVAAAQLAAVAEQPVPVVCATLFAIGAQLVGLPGVPPHVMALISRLLENLGCPGVSEAPPVCPTAEGVNLATRNRLRAQVPGGTTVTLDAGQKTTVGSPRGRCIASTSLVVSAPAGAVTHAVVQGGVEVRCNAAGGGSVRVDFDDALSPNPFFITVICT